MTAFGVLCKVYTGYPILFSEMTILTALRTAATSVVAAKYLARDQLGKPGMSGICEYLDMIADPDDPRDLYGMVVRSGNLIKVA